MALYAYDEGILIHAGDAEAEKIYECVNCFRPVRRRKGRCKTPHFYHIQEAPSCRLYSKSEDHLTAQVELEKMFPRGALQIEKPFIEIDRVADLCWEKEKIIFEIQCSQITKVEADSRIRDYKTKGYDVVWLMDDRRYNKRISRPAEEYLRTLSAYYLSIESMEVYDQFEIFSDGKRVRKGRPFPVDLTKVFKRGENEFSPELYPKQIIRLNLERYFYGDRMSRALRFPEEMLREKEIEKNFRKPSRLFVWLKKYLLEPYVRWLDGVAKRC
ncbi:MAG: hypothetical protein K1X28_07885 [Parachlamydiales bacterium]|nr:hypothetical protein [Parachlamydiales bacterium]